MERKLVFAAIIGLISLFEEVVGAPQLQVIPGAAVVRQGENVSLLCRSGKPLQYCRIEQIGTHRSWNLKPGSAPSGEWKLLYHGSGLESGQCGFTIEHVQAANNGQYRCTMGFLEGSEEAIGVMNLTVAVSPSEPVLDVFTTPDEDGEFKDGDLLQAKCVISDGRPVSNISWYMGETPLKSDLSMTLLAHVKVQDVYSIEQNISYPLTWEDHGKSLRCVAQHMALEMGTKEKTYQIRVKFPPREHSEPVEKFGLIIGEPTDISVPVHGNPKPNIIWSISDKQLTEHSSDETGHLKANSLEQQGNGVWLAVLHIASVTMEDIDHTYVLKARNIMGEQSYRIILSTNSEATVMQLSAGAIIGIVVAIMVLLLAIFLLYFTRATGRWCFAGGVSTRQDPKESSDTESADHGPAQRSKKTKAKFYNIFKKKSDKVGDDTEMAKPGTMEDDKSLDRPVIQPVEQHQPPQPKQGDSIVYAELDLKDLQRGIRRPQVRAEDDKTEYAEIVYTTKADEERGTQ